VTTLAETEAADSELRAKLYREQRQKRIAYQSQLRLSLAGSSTAWRTLYGHWLPFFDWLAEREQPPVDPQSELDPLGISDQVNVGR